jgi:CubicO group peptidase (beta-lactamase class C family)
MKKQLIIFYIILTVCFVSCKVENDRETVVYVYQEPISRGDGWETSTLTAQGIDGSLITQMIVKVKENIFKNIHGILIIRNENLVLEEYFPGDAFRGSYTEFDWNVLHFQASCTKSFASALIGIAFDKGYLNDLNAKLYSFFPEYTNINWSNEKQQITLKHLLTMTAGLDWDEWSYSYTDSKNSAVQMYNSGDPVRFVLEVPLALEPGTTFRYNTGLSILLGGIIKNATSLPADQFAELYLFAPLGIREYYWYIAPNGTVDTGGGLNLSPRNMAKFGQLYLNGGTWKGEQVISPGWINESVKQHISRSSRGGYGFQWWTEQHLWNGNIIDSFSAKGWGGQYIYVFPDLAMVVVFTGGNYYTGADPALTMLDQYILPAVY